MVDHTLEAETGRRIHTAIGIALTSGPQRTCVDIAKEACVGLELSQSERRAIVVRCATAIGTYVGRCRPLESELLALEEPVGKGVADLVWRHPTGAGLLPQGHVHWGDKGPGEWIFVDEIKSGFAGPGDYHVGRQVCRLIIGGTHRWPDRFAGVRVIPLCAPQRSWIVTADLTIVYPIGPSALEIR